MPIKLIELEREEAKKEAVKLAKEASRKAKAALKKKSNVKETISKPNANKSYITDLQEDKVSKVKVKNSNPVSNGVTTTASITAENSRSVVNSMKSNFTKNLFNKTLVSSEGLGEMFYSTNLTLSLT